MRRRATGVVGFRDANDRFHHIREAAATAAALLQAVIYLCRHDELPCILIEEIDDRLFDLPIRDDVAMTDQHASQSSRWSIGLFRKPVPTFRVRCSGWRHRGRGTCWR